MQKCYKLENGRLQPSDEADAQVVVVVSPDASQRDLLIQSHQIDEHTFNSALDTDELARIEYEDDYTAIIFKKPKSYTADDQFQFKVSSFGVFIYEDVVVVLTDTELPLVDERRFSKMGSLKAFVLRLLNYSIYHFTEHLKIINKISDEIEQKIESSMKNEYLIYMFSLGKGLTYYLNAINSNDMLLRRLQSARSMAFSEVERDLLEDLMIENQQCLRQAEIYSNILANMAGARSSIVSNNLNILMKTLNLLTVGIMVPTFVVSAFSMNVPIPMSEFKWAFSIIMALAALSVGIFMWIYKKKNW
jgi:magnesium transporter